MNTYGLGVSYEKETCTFAVHAPYAQAVVLQLYKEKPANYEEGEAHEMLHKKGGIWQITLSGDYNGYVYMFGVTDADGKISYNRDPYAVAATANGYESVVVDLAATNPADFDKYKHISLALPVDAVVYEVHIRDFSMDKEIPFTHRGKFLSMTQEGLKTKEGQSAGLDSLKELGITHVQLMPIFDSAEVNEALVDAADYQGRKYNWGYDPHNYNVPEGAYATDCTKPEVRIRECKEMIKAFHKAGIGVIMDVVYNHTFSIENGPFGALGADYYYRKKKGAYANGACCGNEVATEKKLVRAYILDSLKYWVTEYGMDGFRFDLMGLIDIDTMKEVSKELRKLKPDILLYGEPWQAGGSPLLRKKQTLKGSQKGLGFGVFNDNIRDSIKGSTRGEDGAFVQGEAGFEEEICEGICGAVHSFTDCAAEAVNYAGAHDDLNLWDKINLSLGRSKEEGFLHMRDGVCIDGRLEDYFKKTTPHHGITKANLWEQPCVRACVLADSIVLTAQGIPFFYAGDEILRTKYGDPNTYKSGDEINQIRWNDKDTFHEVFAFYKKLIALRKAHPAFRMTSRKMIEEKLLLQSSQGYVGCLLKEHANGDEWENIFVIYNGSSHRKNIVLPNEKEWSCVLKTPDSAGEKQEEVVCKNTISVQGTSIVILRQ